MHWKFAALISLLVTVGCGGGGPPAVDTTPPPEDVTPDTVAPDTVAPDTVTPDSSSDTTAPDASSDQVEPDAQVDGETPDTVEDVSPDTVTPDVTPDEGPADTSPDQTTSPDTAQDTTPDTAEDITPPEDTGCTSIVCEPGEIPVDTNLDGCIDECQPDPCACPLPFAVCLENGQSAFNCAAEAECAGYCECGTAGCFGECYNKGVCQGPDCDCSEDQLGFEVCGMDGQTYENSCALMEAYDCAPEETVLLHLGPCVGNACDCPNDNVPVCGSDGISYTNNCHLNNCSIGSPTVACGGACQSSFFEPTCLLCEESCDPVCGKDGKTYANECLAACSTVEVEHTGACCACDSNNVNPVCGSDANTYTNLCSLNCASIQSGVTLAYSGPCQCDCTAGGPTVCAADGQTYQNECFAQCAGTTVVFEGTCSSADCPCDNSFDPVCGLDGVTYPNSCMAACKGAVVASSGVCFSCQSQACVSFEPYCGEDGMTYPSPEFFSFECAKGTLVWSSKEPCSACETETDCNDLNPCTTDTCGSDGACAFTPIDGCTDTPAWAPDGANCP